MVESGKAQVETKEQEWASWREMVMPCRLRYLSQELCQNSVFHHALSRPRFGVLHPSQDRRKGYPLERPLPILQTPPLEQRSLPEQRFPLEQPHHMTPERSKLVSEGQVEEEEVWTEAKEFRLMVPPHPP